MVVRPTFRQQKRRLMKKLAAQERMNNLASARESMEFVMRMWASPDGDKNLVERCGMDASHMLHIGMGQQNREDAVHVLKLAVAEFVAAHAGKVEADGGSDIEQGMPQWNYVHYAEIRKKAGGGGHSEDYPMLCLLLEYIPWAEEASIFVCVLNESQIATLPPFHRKQWQQPSSSSII